MKTAARFLLLIGAAAALVAAPALAAGLQVELQAQAVLEGGQVLLADVAQVRGDDAQAVQRLSQLRLGKTPRAGEDMRISRERLMQWAARQLGGAASRAQWSGADAVVIAGAGAAATPQAAATAPREPRRDAPAVSRGDWVTLLSRAGNIQLESSAEALQDARIGQPVKVRTAGGAAAVVARVTAPGRVEVNP